MAMEPAVKLSFCAILLYRVMGSRLELLLGTGFPATGFYQIRSLTIAATTEPPGPNISPRFRPPWRAEFIYGAGYISCFELCLVCRHVQYAT